MADAKLGNGKCNGLITMISVVAAVVAITLALAGGAWGMRDRMTRVETKLERIEYQLDRIEAAVYKPGRE